MKKIIFVLVSLIAFNSQAHKLSICKGEFALCAASSTTQTGKTMVVDGKVFKE